MAYASSRESMCSINIGWLYCLISAYQLMWLYVVSLGKRININNKKNAHTAHCFLYKRFQVLVRHIPCNSFTWANWHFAFFNMNILTISPDIRFYSEKLRAKGLHSWWLGTWLYWTCKKAGSSPTQENIESSKARSFFSVEIPYLQSQFQRCSRL